MSTGYNQGLAGQRPKPGGSLLALLLPRSLIALNCL